MNMWQSLKALFTKKNKGKVHSFTYFIPAPPKRQHGYREKQFDKVFFEFVNQGYEILSVHTQALSGSGQPGMWVLITARGGPNDSGISEESLWPFEAGSDEVILEGDHNTTLDDKIDGLYFIKNNKG